MANQKVCIICGESKRSGQLLKHKNSLLNDKFSICRECANKYTDFSDHDSIMLMAQLTNLPYVKDVVSDIAKTEKEPNFGAYTRKLAPYKKYKTFSDSQFNSESIEAVTEVTEEMIQRWGKDYSEEEYAYLESSLRGLMTIKPATTALEIQRYVVNIKLKAALDDALKEGDFKAIPQLRKAYAEDSKDLGLDAVLSGKDDSGKSLGQRIGQWELNAPIPDDERYNDASGLEKYIRKWFVIPMKRTMGVASEKEVESLYED